MKRILCYGDSNTFGFNPRNGSRFDENIRWSAQLRNILNNCEIIEEGANNRTGFVNNPAGFLYSSSRHFPKIITKIKNLDVIILSVGTNDLQYQYNISFNTIENGLEKLILIAKEYTKNLVIIPPVIIGNTILNNFLFNKMFDETSIIKSRKSAKIYKKLAKVFNCYVFDFNEIVSPSLIDGLHYEEKEHTIIAHKLAEFLVKL